MSTIIASQRPVDIRQRQGTEGAAPTFFEGVGASFRSTEDDLSHVQEKRKFDAYQELEDNLLDRGYRQEAFRHKAVPLFGVIPISGGGVPNTDAIWSAVARERARDPKAFAALPATQDEYDRWILNRRGASQRDASTLSRSGIGGQIVGGVAGSMTDPFNILTMPVGGGGKTIVETMVRGALANVALEAVQTPQLKLNREARGETLTVQEAATNLVFAGVGGGVLSGVGKGIEVGAPKVGAAVRGRFEALVADNWDRLPDAMRARMTKGAPLPDHILPDLAEELVGRANMSVDERMAVDGLRRAAEVEAASPFLPGLPGHAAHRERLDATIAALLQPVSRQSTPFAMPARPQSGPRDMGAVSRGAMTGPVDARATGARQDLKARIGHVESGGSDTAANPRSSARGRYQFISSTWLAYYKRRFGSQGLSDDQILAKRSDGAVQETLMDDLLDDNARVLRSVGEAESAGNLYLVHFAGPGGARRIFGADPEASAASVLGVDAVRANSFLSGMTASDIIGWAHRKMGAPVARRAGARSELAGEGVYRDTLQADIDRQDAIRDQVARERAARVAAGQSEIDDMLAANDAPPRIGMGDDDILPAPLVRDPADDLPDLPAPRVDDGAPDRAMVERLVPQMTVLVDSGARLNNIAKLAKDLNALPADVEAALGQLVARGRLLRRPAKDGGDARFVRVPRDSGPVDIIKFMARNGGLRDDEGHGLGLRDLSAREKRKMVPAAQRALFRKRQATEPRYQKFVQGGGMLLRHEGRPVDEMGELLYEAGYFAERPTSADVLAALDDAIMSGKTILAADDVGRLPADDLMAGSGDALKDLTDEIGEWAFQRGFDLDDTDIADMARIMNADENMLHVDAAFSNLVNQRSMDAMLDLYYEVADETDYFDAIAAAVDGGGAGEGGAGRAGLPTDASASGQRAAFAAIDPEEFDQYAGSWDGADAAEALAQTASLRHDIDNSDLFGGPTRAEVRESLERQGDGGLSSGAAQKPVGSEGGLFDTAARDEAEFFLDDGGARSWSDIAADLDLDDIELKNLRDCL